jgi:hypothetical protein
LADKVPEAAGTQDLAMHRNALFTLSETNYLFADFHKLSKIIPWGIGGIGRRNRLKICLLI